MTGTVAKGPVVLKLLLAEAGRPYVPCVAPSPPLQLARRVTGPRVPLWVEGAGLVALLVPVPPGVVVGVDETAPLGLWVGPHPGRVTVARRLTCRRRREDGVPTAVRCVIAREEPPAAPDGDAPGVTAPGVPLRPEGLPP